jgi:hypothetical protein
VPLSCFHALLYEVAVDGLFSQICCSLSVLNDIVFGFMLVFISSGMVWCYCDTLLVEWFPDIFLERIEETQYIS